MPHCSNPHHQTHPRFWNGLVWNGLVWNGLVFWSSGLMGCGTATPSSPPSSPPTNSVTLVEDADAEEADAEEADPSPERSAYGLVVMTLDVSGHPVRAEIADTPSLRRKGLMHRPSLAPDHGMLFVYPDAQERSFWMRNTILPLSIAYVDSDGVIVHLADMMPLDESSVPSQAPAMYALEMPQGWFDGQGVSVGGVISGLPGPSQD